MGVMNTNLTMNDATKIVVVEVLDRTDCYEIAHVYGNNVDFDVICRFPLSMPEQFSAVTVERFLQNCGRSDLPVFTCKISHNNSVMTKDQAFALILEASEPWERSDLEFDSESRSSNEVDVVLDGGEEISDARMREIALCALQYMFNMDTELANDFCREELTPGEWSQLNAACGYLWL